MFWDKKGDKSSLPELPPMKLNPMFPMEDEEEKVEISSLPTFPNTPMHNSFAQSAIKEAVNPSECEPEENILPEIPSIMNSTNLEKIERIPFNQNQKFKTIEMKEWQPEQRNYKSEAPKLQEITPATEHNFPEFSDKQQMKEKESTAQDIFVKIDKFRAIRKALKDTSVKLEEIDSMLQRVREIKMREEQELSSWEKEISAAKSRIQDINSSVFEKVK